MSILYMYTSYVYVMMVIKLHTFYFFLRGLHNMVFIVEFRPFAQYRYVNLNNDIYEFAYNNGTYHFGDCSPYYMTNITILSGHVQIDHWCI